MLQQTSEFKYHQDGSQAPAGSVFVFGSNLSGYHGGGAALEARQSYGAIYGKGIGFMGSSYAIPTKDEWIYSLKIDRIESYVNIFVRATYDNPNMNFFITRVGCGLAGFKDSEIAPLFKGCNTNCSFANEWAIYLK